MTGVTVKFPSGLKASDPVNTPVLVIGQPKDLAKVQWDAIKVKLEPRVAKELWSAGVSALNPAPTDSVSLYMNLATVAALPVKVSRHNTTSRSHFITKVVRSCSSGGPETVVIVCSQQDMYASGCAVGRAYSVYTRKTQGEALAATPRLIRDIEVSVEFLLVSDDSEVAHPAALTPDDIKCLEVSCSAVQMAARLVDAPCNEVNTTVFTEEALALAKELGVVTTVIKGEELRDRGFGGLYGVGKASLHPPALVVLSHTPSTAKQSIAWVGKGIVYDTGGLSIKGKTAMPGMKRDCGGAAGVLGAFKVAVSNGFSDNLHCILCLAENSVGPAATRPDDIHTLYSGKTVEINNTDAEGRLVLADGVAFAAKDLKCDIVLDMATLTGAQGISHGRYHAAHLSNSPSWEMALFRAGLLSGDLTFPSVYCPEMQFPEFTSAVADMKNSVADRNNAQPSCAGLFINANLGFDWPGVWMHVDMAAPAVVNERATGYGVCLLNCLFGTASKSTMLQAVSPNVENGSVDYESSQSYVAKKLRRE